MAPRLSKKEYLILDLLRGHGALFGLQMVQLSGEKLKRGTVYVTLSRMAEKGLVESQQEREPNQAGLPRRVYNITGAGRIALHAEDAAIIAFREGGTYA